MFSYFWKKITILNIGIFIIIFRTFGFLLDYINKKISDDTIFLKIGENGYPFLDSINYNIEDIKQISKSINNTLKNNNLNIKNLLDKIGDYKCSFINTMNICGNKEGCIEELNKIEKEEIFFYHQNEKDDLNETTNIHKIINLIRDKNNFYCDSKNKINDDNKKEITLFNRVINGYYSYLIIILHQQNLARDNKIIKRITENESNLNDLFYLYILNLICYTKTEHIYNNIKINKLLEYNEDQINSEIDEIIKRNISDEIEYIFNNEIKELISCLPNSNMRNSYLLDIKSIGIMLKTLFNKTTTAKDKLTFKFFFKEFSNRINIIFQVDNTIKSKSDFYKKSRIYVYSIYWIVAFLGTFYTNKNYIKHKEFYTSKTRMLKNTNKNYNFKKYLKYRQNIQKLQQINSNQKPKYTKEELEYIEKLTKNNGNEFVISK